MGRPASLLLCASVVVFLLLTAAYGNPISLRGEDRARESDAFLRASDWSSASATYGGKKQNSIGPLLARQAIVGFPRQSRSDGDKEGWDHDKTEGGAMDWYWFRRRRYFNSWAAETSAETPVYPDTQRPDTQRPDIQSPDTQRPYTLRPDTKRPDPQRPDTQHPDTQRPAIRYRGTQRRDHIGDQ
ncbi:Histone-lysine N-methyltransferase prdm9 [Branchiostoma belcheri]|nr:Histone-lysine N-methyltransferase prdm9 [Branchiostoma belcheri]